MGVLGMELGSAIGSGLGGYVGKKFLKNEKAGERIGSVVGKIGGSYLPFKNGGMVTRKTQHALLHQGELVVPKKYVKDVSKSLKKKIKKNGGVGMGKHKRRK
jgi:uncharacterized protein YcfJ